MKKILIIEDEFSILELYERVLKQAGFEVEMAEDGEIGLELASNKPDLILLDIMLPKINGIEILKQLKADVTTKEIPIVLITNLGQENVIRRAFELGAQGYLLKVRISPYELIEQVNTYLADPKYKMDPNKLSFD